MYSEADTRKNPRPYLAPSWVTYLATQISNAISENPAEIRVNNNLDGEELALMFLLLGSKNYQWCPKGVKRIGWIALTIVPNNEIRCLNIFVKTKHKATYTYRDRSLN